MLKKSAVTLAVVLALLAFYTHYSTLRINRIYAPTGSIEDVDGAGIHYVDQGAGRSIILLHGASGNLRDFTSSISKALSEHFRVVSIDRPGLGHSTRQTGFWPDPSKQAEIVFKLLNKLDIKDPILVGHSWSGALVTSFLLDFPGFACGGILIAPAIYAWNTPASFHNRVAGIPFIGRLIANTVILPLGQLFMNPGIKYVLAPGEVPKNYRTNTAIDTVLRPETFLANAADMSGLSDYLRTRQGDYENIQTPLMAITGEQDSVVSNQHHVGQLKQALPGLKLVTIQGSGHAPHQTHPHQVVEIIGEFAESL